MAYLRTSDSRIRGEGLDVFVDTMMKSFARQFTLRNAEDESRFQRSVLEDDLPLEAQLDYRKEQLKRIGDDPAERRRIKEEIANLKDRIQQKKFSDEYLAKLTENASGVSSLESVIGWLNDYLSQETDEGVKTLIRQELYKKENDKFTITQSILKNQTDYALNDKSESILNTQIARVSSARSQSLLSGNNELVSVYDLQLQALQKALRESSIDNTIKNFAVSSLVNASSAVSLLDAYNSKISSSAVSGPVKVGSTTYASEREYWTYARDSYVSETGPSGFFPRFKNENDDAIKSLNSTGSLGTNNLRDISGKYDSLLARPELAQYGAKVASEKTTVLQTGADFMTNTLINTFSRTGDFRSVIAPFDAIKALGLNVDDNYTKVLLSAANTASTQTSELMAAAYNEKILNPDKPYEQIIKEQSAKGAASYLSPEQLVTKSPEEIAQASFTGQEKSAYGPETRSTAPNAAQNVPPIVPPQQPPPPQPTPVTPFSRQLDLGATGTDVKSLQQFLNKLGFSVAPAGQAGSAGFETEYFGPATQAALKKFQAAQGIVSSGDPISTGYGRVGPQTIKKLNELYK